MNTNLATSSAYERAQHLMAQGRLAQAADLCKQMLDTDPNDAYGYHLMATLFSATGTFERALTFAQLATQLAPDISDFHIQKGQVLYSLGEYEQAAISFMSAYNLDPENPVLLLLLANTFARRAQYSEAHGLFLRARQISDIPEIDEQEGLCLLLQGKSHEAESHFERLIGRCPDYPWGHIHKARLLMDGRHNTQAEASMARAHKLAPSLFEPVFALAVLNDWQGQSEIAIRYAMEAIRLRPMAWECHIYLGGLLMKERHYKEADQALRQALSLRPTDAYALQLFIECAAALGQAPQSIEWIQNSLTINPGNEILQHALFIAGGQQPTSTPLLYLASYYDSFSEQYDHYQHHIVCSKAPHILSECLRQSDLMPSPPRTLLDVGCGTGLVAQALQDLTSHRTGIDLSARMIEKARHKNLYHHLYLQDASTFMLESRSQYDVVTAIGMLPCMGDIGNFIQSARNVVSPSGILALSFERDEEETAVGYRLKPSGRYCHSMNYVFSLLQAKGYQLMLQQEATLHLDLQTPITGVLVLVKKATTH